MNNKISSNNNNNFKASIKNTFKYAAGISAALITALLIWVATTLVNVDKRTTTLVSDVKSNTDWIRAWYKDLNVPERDANQDSAIIVLQEEVKDLRKYVADLKIKYAQLGGPNDPLWSELEKASIRIASIEEYVRR